MARGANLAVKTMDSDPNVRKAVDRADPRKRDVLDRSRDFDTVWTSGRPSEAAYFQRGSDGVGRHYDGQGRRVQVEGDEDREKVETKTIQQTRAATAARFRKAAEQLESGEEPDIDGIDESGVNLAAWGRREAQYRFAVVRTAIEQRFHKVIHNERDARDFLVEVKIITASDAKAAKIAGSRR